MIKMYPVYDPVKKVWIIQLQDGSLKEISNEEYVKMFKFKTRYNKKENIMTDIHPSPADFTAEQIETDPILRFFHYSHLPQSLRTISEPFCVMAKFIVATLPRNAERSTALRKLLEAKDCAVRAAV